MDLLNLAYQFAKAATYQPPHKPDAETVGRIKAAIDAFLEDKGVPDSEYVACAGTAMYLHGLRDTLNDIDLLVPGVPDTEGMYQGMEVDSHADWDSLRGRPVPGFTSEILANKVNIGGIWTMDIPSIIKFKQTMGRPKDVRDLAILEEHTGL